VKVLLLSAYAAQSHVYWQEALLAMFPKWQWRVLSLPPRHFSWRVRGNPLYWALEERETLAAGYDLVIATSMVDLATLRGLVPRLAVVPTIVYFHENQFEYPAVERKTDADGRLQRSNNLLEAQMVSLYSALAADRVVFNSRYNLTSFHSGCQALLKRLPDKVPAGIVSSLRDKSTVLPVPLKDAAQVAARDSSIWGDECIPYPQRALRLVWVGRFEYDKGGDRLLQILQHLELRGLHYDLAVIGQQFRHSPQEFKHIETQFAHRLVQFGYLESRSDYLAALAGADIVLSTALHEFQGLAILEAISAGCIPIVPQRLVYPEIIPEAYCYTSHMDDMQSEAEAVVALLCKHAQTLGTDGGNRPDVSPFTSLALLPQYEALFCGVARGA
jgi:glycosyltransferase involved in cell wall biosynthesis